MCEGVGEDCRGRGAFGMCLDIHRESECINMITFYGSIFSRRLYSSVFYAMNRFLCRYGFPSTAV